MVKIMQTRALTALKWLCTVIAVALIVVALTAVSDMQSVKENSTPIYRDIRPGVDVVIFPAPPDGYQGALSPKGVMAVWSTLLRRWEQADLNNLPVNRLRALQVRVEPGPATSSRAGGETIVITDGHLRAATLFAYAVGRLESDQKILRCYNLWFDLFVDAMTQGDPVVHLDSGAFTLLRQLGPPSGSSTPTSEKFQETIFGWTAFLLAHEAGHILLNHGPRLTTIFPALPDNPLAWPPEAAAMGRDFELEADAIAVDLTLAANLFSASAISAWFQWQALRNVASMAQAGVDVVMHVTHPPPVERFRQVLTQFAKREPRPGLPVETMIAGFEQLIGKYDRALRSGTVNDLFPMRNRPADVGVVEERVIKRISELKFCQ